MTIEISAENLAKIDAAVASGAFASREEAVGAAIDRGLPSPLVERSGQRVHPLHSQSKEEVDAWVRGFDKWIDSIPKVDHRVDDSRESIYSGTMDDTR